MAGAKPVIGTFKMSIDSGASLEYVWDEEVTGRGYVTGGQQVEKEVSAVIERSLFDFSYPSESEEYEGKKATRGDKTYRVERIERGDSFVTVHLVDESQAA